MDCNALPNFEEFINNLIQMGVQKQIPNKAMHPCFQIPNAPADLSIPLYTIVNFLMSSY